jgi:hypothetical protein
MVVVLAQVLILVGDQPPLLVLVGRVYVASSGANVD